MNQETLERSQQSSWSSAASTAPICGLINPSGTACYINTSLLLLCYTCTPIVTHYCIRVIISNNNNNRTLLHDDVSNVTAVELMVVWRTILSGGGGGGGRCCCCMDDVNGADHSQHHHHSMAAAAAVDPSRLYQSLLQNDAWNNIRYTECGDAVSVLIQLIQFLRQENNKSIQYDDINHQETTRQTPQQQQPVNWVDRLLHSGQVYTVLTGSSSSTTTQTTKVLKVRPLMNPLPVTIQQDDDETNTTFTSLSDALHHMLNTEQPVEGYRWGPESNVTTTTRRWHVLSFPPILMIHLQRFEILHHHHPGSHTADDDDHAPPHHEIDINIDTDRQQQVTTSIMLLKPMEDRGSHLRIPNELDLSLYLSTRPPPPPPSKLDKVDDTFSRHHDNDDHDYQLIGGILHIHDYSKSDDDDASVGHYVTVVRRQRNGEEQWYVLDDDDVALVSHDQVVLWLGGGWYQHHHHHHHHHHTSSSSSRTNGKNSTSDQLFARGIVLVYRQRSFQDPMEHSNMNPTTNFGDTSFFGSTGVMVEVESLLPVPLDILTGPPFLPGTGIRHTTTTSAPTSYWLDDSDDDECESTM